MDPHTQYWNIFLGPLLFATKFCHVRIWPTRRRRKFWMKHWCQDSEFDCSVFFSKYCRIAKQSDHLFDISKQLSSYFTGLTSIHSRKWHGSVTVGEEDIGIHICFGLASATGFPVLSPMSSVSFSWVSSVIPVTYLFILFTIMSSIVSWSWSRFRSGLDGNWLLPPRLDRPACFHGTILSLWIMSCLEVKWALYMLSSSASSRVVKYCPFATVFVIWWSGRLSNFCSESCSKLPLHLVIGPKRFVRCRQFCWHHHGLRIVLSNRFPCTFWTTRESPGQFVAHIRYCSVNTELIDGKDCAKNHFGCVVVTTEMYRQCSSSFASQSSSFQSTGSKENGTSTFNEADHQCPQRHGIPFSIRLVRVSSVPFLFWSRPKKRPMSVRETSCIFFLRFGNSLWTILRFLFFSIQCRCTLTWRWFVLGVAQVPTVFHSSCSGSRREAAM